MALEFVETKHEKIICITALSLIKVCVQLPFHDMIDAISETIWRPNSLKVGCKLDTFFQCVTLDFVTDRNQRLRNSRLVFPGRKTPVVLVASKGGLGAKEKPYVP